MKLTIITSKYHMEVDQPAAEVLSTIQEMGQKRECWTYLDGHDVSVETITLVPRNCA
jgi:methionyl-tRNA formyltransferase